ncbi:hypothetical protein HPP92_022163 [Vanilla planifolia]|uniref:DUF8204 domain-containing protein n=1 Tax=Vanilla planifolia TaxID=51239 RepID=A0A835PRQ2_VANPL|nr:hypothetical protein HPP92_022163 [Vanilla planifolia]
MEEPSGGGGGDQSKSTGVSSSYRGKSCKGCLYYSSAFKSNARNPLCVGIGRTLPQVPNYIVGESEMEATNDGRNLLDFKYACVGYSVYLDKNEDKREKERIKQNCHSCGLELLVDRRASSSSNAPARVHNKEGIKQAMIYVDSGNHFNKTVELATIPIHPRRRNPSAKNSCPGKFSRNAGLVASAVARNLNRVGNYIKETFDDILYPYRRRPK